jgi:hypothetical protein
MRYPSDSTRGSAAEVRTLICESKRLLEGFKRLVNEHDRFRKTLEGGKKNREAGTGNGASRLAVAISPVTSFIAQTLDFEQRMVTSCPQNRP